ncbi:hypothetical protein H8D30_01950 [bacterium]|nr:hypothetical protein [bacterium]
MKITNSLKRLSPTKVRIVLRMGRQDFESEKAGAVKELAKTIRLDGFRKGKVPVEMVQKMINEEGLREELSSQIWEKHAEEILEKKGVTAVRLEELTNKPWRGGVQITAILEAVPPFDLRKIKRLKVDFELPKPVKDADVKDEISRLIEESTEMVPVTLVEEGDFLRLKGLFKSGEEEEEVERGFEAREQLLPSTAFLGKVVGAKEGDGLVFKTKFSETYPRPELAGKMVDVKVEVVSAFREIRPTREEMSQRYGFGDAASFEKRLREHLGVTREEESMEKGMAGLPDAFWALNRRYVPPPTLVAQEKEEAWLRVLEEADRAGEEAPEEEEWWESVEEDVMKGVASNLILDAVADERAIEVTEEDLQMFYQDVARRVRRPLKKIVSEARKRGEIGKVARNLRRQKTRRRLVREIMDRKGGK